MPRWMVLALEASEISYGAKKGKKNQITYKSLSNFNDLIHLLDVFCMLWGSHHRICIFLFSKVNFWEYVCNKYLKIELRAFDVLFLNQLSWGIIFVVRLFWLKNSAYF